MINTSGMFKNKRDGKIMINCEDITLLSFPIEPRSLLERRRCEGSEFKGLQSSNQTVEFIASVSKHFCRFDIPR